MLYIRVVLEIAFINKKRLAKDNILKIKVLLSEYTISADINEKTNILAEVIVIFLGISHFNE